MIRFRYIGDEPREVSILPAGVLRLLEPDELFYVGEDHAASYECQPALYVRDEPPASGVAVLGTTGQES